MLPLVHPSGMAAPLQLDETPVRFLAGSARYDSIREAPTKKKRTPREGEQKSTLRYSSPPPEPTSRLPSRADGCLLAARGLRDKSIPIRNTTQKETSPRTTHVSLKNPSIVGKITAVISSNTAVHTQPHATTAVSYHNREKKECCSYHCCSRSSLGVCCSEGWQYRM